MKPLTRKQQAIFDFVVAYQQNHGRTPTGPEIASHFGYTDPSSAYQHLQLIEKKGYFRIDQLGHKRPLRVKLTELGHHLVGKHWPMFGSIPAGPLSMVLGEDTERVESVEDILPMIRQGDYFLRVEGDSMIRAGLEEGMIVLMRPFQQAQSGDICAVWVSGEGGTLKRVFFEGDQVRLVPENDAYKERVYSADQIRIQGVLIAALSVAQFKKF